VPKVRPDTVIGDETPVPTRPPGLDVTVYKVMGKPPVFTGGVKEILAIPNPVIAALTAVGASGRVVGVAVSILEG
jgi:hypothetical protein